MSYRKEWKQSPNFTPGAQTSAIYGRGRTVEIGAGHWWGLPQAGYSHQGVVNSFLNAARQVSANAVLSSGLVTEMVRREDTSWCTGSANPYTYSIEVDPRIQSGDQGVRNTLVEYLADTGLCYLPWKPHKYWMQTECNPIDWESIRRDAVALAESRKLPSWKNGLETWSEQTWYTVEGAALRDLTNPGKVIKTFSKNTPILIKGKAYVAGKAYLLSKFAFENGTGQGISDSELSPNKIAEAEKPEWQRNLVDILPVKLMVIPSQTAVVNLKDLSVIKNIGQGTWIDFGKKTTVNGKTYLISSYSAANAMPNGILEDDVKVPAVPPKSEKPAWLEKWQDIVDVKMYARADTDLVDLVTGKSIKTIARATPVDISSTTEWHGQKYAITAYSTEKKLGQGIRLDDLDMKIVDSSSGAVSPAPEQPDIEEVKKKVTLLQAALDALKAILGIK